jgi:hypothetical protein
LFSFIANALGASTNPSVYGKILTVFALVGYWGSIPFWYLAGKSYTKHMEKQNMNFNV